MTTPAEPSKSKKPGNPPPPPAVNPDLDEQLHGAWQKYGQTAIIACGLVLLFYVCKGGWDYLRAQRENDVAAEFAAAKTPDQLKTFVSAHPGHKLAGVAEVQMADDDYAAGKMAQAIDAYRDGIAKLGADPLADRAKIGLAMSQVQSGQTAAGQESLSKMLNDPTELGVIRAEAGYQLASLAAAAGRGDQVQKLAMQLLQIDRESPWARQTFSLMAEVPAAPAPAAAPAAPAPASISFKPAGK